MYGKQDGFYLEKMIDFLQIKRCDATQKNLNLLFIESWAFSVWFVKSTIHQNCTKIETSDAHGYCPYVG